VAVEELLGALAQLVASEEVRRSQLPDRSEIYARGSKAIGLN
jgi:hypothetical protein